MQSASTDIAARTASVISDHQGLEGPLLPILHGLQHEFGYVPHEALPIVANALNLSRAEVYGVVSFYHDFRKAPAGRHVLKLCQAEACQSMGSDAVAATMPGLGHVRGSLILERTGQTPAQRADGPSACPGDSSHERGRVGASDNPWDMQQAEKSIRVRNAGEDLLPRPGSAQRSSALGWATARVSRKRHAGCPHPNHAGAAGAVKRPVVPHAPTAKQGTLIWRDGVNARRA